MKNIDETQISVGGRKKVFPQDVLLMKASINYTELLLINGTKIFVATNIGRLESKFENYRFFRPNKSYIVNLDYAYVAKDLGRVVLNNGVEIGISRRKLNNFIKANTKNISNLNHIKEKRKPSSTIL